MTFVFLSDCYNHHQSAFSEAMYRLTEGQYTFVATKPIGSMRRSLGWGIEQDPPFLKNWYTDDASRLECEKIIQEADVVIAGSAPEHLLAERIRSEKLIIRYTERIFKKFTLVDRLKMPVRRVRYKQVFNHKNMYLLCSSAYTAGDFARTGNFRGKTYKWGYFPKTEIYESIDALLDQKRKNSILWVARLIDLKHPEIPVLVAKQLKEAGYSFELNMIGNGEWEERLVAMIKEHGLQKHVHLLGTMKPEEVRAHMDRARIFLFTSDRNEGWGAVLNESMNSGCAVVANSAIGSVPFLMQHEYNGLMYRDGDVTAVYAAVKSLLDNPEQCRMFGKHAYETIQTTWNAEEAARRLLVLVDELRTLGESHAFSEGPCSRADILKDGWFKR